MIPLYYNGAQCSTSSPRREVPSGTVGVLGAGTIASYNHLVVRWFGQSVSRALMIFAERTSVGKMSRSEETPWRRRTDGRRRAGPGRAGRRREETSQRRRLVSRLTTGRMTAISQRRRETGWTERGRERGEKTEEEKEGIVESKMGLRLVRGISVSRDWRPPPVQRWVSKR